MSDVTEDAARARIKYRLAQLLRLARFCEERGVSLPHGKAKARHP